MVLLLSSTASVWAQDDDPSPEEPGPIVCIDGIYYYTNAGMIGDDSFYAYVIGPNSPFVEIYREWLEDEPELYQDIDIVPYSGDIVIPSEITIGFFDIPVVGIDDHAFENDYPYFDDPSCTITSITIPNSVTWIGEEAFANCTALKSVNIPNSVMTIRSNAFTGCTALTSITFPGSLTAIGEGVFSNCTGLTSLVIPNTILTIGARAFYGCSGLKSVILSSKLSDIGDRAFYDCNNLTTVTALGIRPANIAANVFPRRTSQTLYVPKGRKSAYENADYWWQFKNIYEIDEIDMTNLMVNPNFTDYEEGWTREAAEGGNVVAGGLADNPCYEAWNNANFDIYQNVGNVPRGVYRISVQGFYRYGRNEFQAFLNGEPYTTKETCPVFVYMNNNATPFTNIYGDPVQITDESFYSSSSDDYGSETLDDGTTVYFPNGMQSASIAFGAGMYTQAAYGLVVNDGDVMRIGVKGSSNQLGDSWSIWDNFKITYCGFKADVVKPLLEQAITDAENLLDDDLSSAVINELQAAISEGNAVVNGNDEQAMFDALATLYELKDRVRSFINFADPKVKALCVANWDTNGDGELSKDEVAAVTSLGEVFFENEEITSFNELQYFTGLDEMGLRRAFEKCSNLSSITLPNNVINIEFQTFLSCTNLTSINIPNSVTEILFAAFARSGLTSIIIPNSVTSIDQSVFRECPNLTSVEIPNSVTKIGACTFQDCPNLTNITLPNSIKGLRQSLFEGCTSLSTVAIPYNVINIDSYVFQNCSSLSSVTIPNSVRSIGSSAFNGCSSLTSFTVEWDNPLAVSNNIFDNVDLSRATLYVPAGTKAAYQSADVWKDFGRIVELVDLVENGTMEEEPSGEWTSFWVHEWRTMDEQFDGPANIVEDPTDDGNHCIKIVVRSEAEADEAGNKTEDGEGNFMTWDSQFFIQSREKIESGTRLRLTMRVRADKPARMETQAHNMPGDYNHWWLFGDIDVTDNWQWVVKEATVSPDMTQEANGKEMHTVAFNLTTMSDGNVLYFDDIKLESFGQRDIIKFADPSVKDICVANWDIDGDGELSMNEAAAVTDLGEAFKGHEEITSFDELQYFTGLTNIGVGSIQGCTGLASVMIPDNVTSIGGWAFNGDWSLRSIVIPESVTTIGWGAFSWCVNLSSVTIPASVTSIEEYAFSNCSSLTSFIVNWENPLSVPEDLFENVPMDQATLYVPEGTKEAYASADVWKDFFNIVEGKFVDLVENGDLEGEPSEDWSSFWVHEWRTMEEQFDGPANIVEDPKDATNHCVKVVVRSEVEADEAGNKIEEGEGNIASWDSQFFIQSKERIESGRMLRLTMRVRADKPATMFTEAHNMPGDYNHWDLFGDIYATTQWKKIVKEVIITPDMTQEENGKEMHTVAFNLTTMPYGNVFYFDDIKLEVLERLDIIKFADPKVKALCVANWDTDGDGELSKDEAAAVTDLGDVFKENGEITSFEELQYFTGITDIGGFSDSNNLTSIVIPRSVESIVGWNFNNCAALSSIKVDEQNLWFDSRNDCNAIIEKATNTLVVGCQTTVIPNDVTAIGTWAFWGRWGMEVMPIPSSVTSIADHAFAWCVNLKQITLPVSITSIGEGAFSNCGGLTSITVEWDVPLAVPENIFEDVPKDKIVLYVPEGTKDAYKSANVWKEFFMDGDDRDAWTAKLLLRELIARLEPIGGYELDEAKATADNAYATKEECEDGIALLQQQIKDRCASAEEGDLPVDATGLVTNPSFTFNNNAYWDGDTPLFQSFNDAEFYMTPFDFHQELTGLPNGRYLLKVKGFHRPGYNEDVYNDYQQGINNASAQLYANEESVTLNNHAAFAQDEQIDGWSGVEVSHDGMTQYIPDNMHDANMWFSNGFYENELPVIVLDGTLNLGIRLDESVDHGWVIFDDFRLEYLGKEPNRLHADEAAVPLVMYRNKTATIGLHLDNEETLTAFQFSLQLPEGFRIAENGDGLPDVVLNSARSDRHKLTVTDGGNGLYSFLCHSNTDKPFKGDSGELLRLTLECDDAVAIDTYQALIENVKFIDENGDYVRLANHAFDIDVAGTLGDVNDNGVVDVQDLVLMVKHILGKTSPTQIFIFPAADHNGDNVIDVMDLVEEVDLIMAYMAAGAPMAETFDKLGGGLSLVTGNDGTVNVSLADKVDYVATQFVVTLSDGQRLEGVTSDKAHVVNFLPLDGNRYFVMGYSKDNAAFSDGEHALTLRISGQGAVNMEAVTFVDTYDETVAFQNFGEGYTTGIGAAVAGTSPVDIYSTGGVLLRRDATSTDGLRGGVYIVKGKKHIKK